MDAVKYLEEKKRMCDSIKYCADCLLLKDDNCSELEMTCPEKAVAIVEKWAEEHPQKTMLMDFLEKYPKAPIDEVNKIPSMCPNHLGYEYECCINCIDCWNRPL